MEDIDKVYTDLTGIDIVEQQRLWDERGKGYYGEYLVFMKLYPRLKGCCKIMMNIQAPMADGKSTEIDLLLIHETGLYVFEMKHYKGAIYGKDTDRNWTQYFRTAPNVTFYNPIHQNHYHIEAIKNLFPGIPIYSYIIFTNSECELHVQYDESNVVVCELNNLLGQLVVMDARPEVIDRDRIDAIFKELSIYCPTTSETISIDGEPVPFHHFGNRIVQNLQDIKQTAKKKNITTRIIAAMIACACIVVSIFSCVAYRAFANEQVASANQKLNEFAKKFEHVVPYNDGNLVLKDGFVTTTDVQLLESPDLQAGTLLQFALNWNGEQYGARISRNTKIIVILNNGAVKEYDLPDSLFSNSMSYILIGKGNAWYSAHSVVEVSNCELYGVKPEEISYIKLSNLDIWPLEKIGAKPKIVGVGYEVQLFSKEP